MSSIGGVPPSGSKAITNFDKVSQDLIQKGEALKGKAEIAIRKAGDELASAGDRSGEAALHLVGATVNAGMAVGYGLKSGAEVAARRRSARAASRSAQPAWSWAWAKKA
jgi:hypothetical protein